MLSIDEAIAHAREVASEQKRRSGECVVNDNECDKFSSCLKCAEEHEQIAEWLEELKAIKSDGFTDDLLNMGFTKGYSKALNDVESEFLMCEKVHYNLQDILCVINKLKEGASDGNG